MRRYRRRGRTFSLAERVPSSPAPSAPLIPAIDEIQHALDAPDRLRALTDELRRQREANEWRLALNVTQEPPGSPTFRNRVVELHRAWEAEDNRIGEELDALNDLQKIIKRQVESMKSLYPEQVKTVLKDQLAPLVAALAGAQEDVMSLTKQIQKLKAEIKALESSDKAGTLPSAK